MTEKKAVSSAVDVLNVDACVDLFPSSLLSVFFPLMLVLCLKLSNCAAACLGQGSLEKEIFTLNEPFRGK